MRPVDPRLLLGRALAAALVLVFVAPAVARAAAVEPRAISVPDLVGLPPSADGSLVRIRGEVLGEALRAGGDNVWLNVLDEGVAVGVVATRSQASVVDGFGDWGRRGSIVEVVGTFNIACEEHEGDLDVHARDVRLVGSSVPISHPVEPWKPFVAAAAVVGGTGMLLVVRALRRRRALL